MAFVCFSLFFICIFLIFVCSIKLILLCFSVHIKLSYHIESIVFLLLFVIAILLSPCLANKSSPFHSICRISKLPMICVFFCCRETTDNEGMGLLTVRNLCPLNHRRSASLHVITSRIVIRVHGKEKHSHHGLTVRCLYTAVAGQMSGS